jgi:hypothetical protein
MKKPVKRIKKIVAKKPVPTENISALTNEVWDTLTDGEKVEIVEIKESVQELSEYEKIFKEAQKPDSLKSIAINLESIVKYLEKFWIKYERT